MRIKAVSIGFWLALSMGAGIAAPADRNEVISSTYPEYLVEPPTADSVSICHGFGCRRITEIDFGPADKAQLTKLMASGKASAEAERKAIGEAGAWFDKRIAPAAGTLNHVAKAGPEHTFNRDGQFDCIDSSRNMTTLLLLLDEYKLLKFHAPDVPEVRGYIIDFKLPHATAVVTERGSGASFAVDAWTRAYGQPPEIMPIARWKAGGGA